MKEPEKIGRAAVASRAWLVADPDVDVVDICLPTLLHREAAERALGAGKHVFLEKPGAPAVSRA